MLTIAILAILVPAVVVGGAALLGRRWLGAERGTGLDVAFGIALGVAAGQIALVGWTGLLPVDATYRIALLAVVAAVFGAVEIAFASKAAVRWAVRALAAAAVLVLLLGSVLEHRWEESQAVVWLAGLFGAILVFQAGHERLAKSAVPPFVPPLLAILWTSAGAAALVLAHSAYLGQLSGSLAATLGALVVLSFRRPAPGLSPGGSLVVASVLAGLWICGYFFAELPASSVVLLWLAPWVALLGGVGPLARRPLWQVTALRIVLVLVVVALAVWFAYTANAVAVDDPYAGY